MNSIDWALSYSNSVRIFVDIVVKLRDWSIIAVKIKRPSLFRSVVDEDLGDLCHIFQDINLQDLALVEYLTENYMNVRYGIILSLDVSYFVHCIIPKNSREILEIILWDNLQQSPFFQCIIWDLGGLEGRFRPVPSAVALGRQERRAGSIFFFKIKKKRKKILFYLEW